MNKPPTQLLMLCLPLLACGSSATAAIVGIVSLFAVISALLDEL